MVFSICKYESYSDDHKSELISKLQFYLKMLRLLASNPRLGTIKGVNQHTPSY